MKKKFTKKSILAFLTMALVLSILLPGTTAQAKSKVAMNKTKVTVCTGKSYTLKMSGISKKVKWFTSDKTIVSITKKSGDKSEKVTIKGNKKGTATVTAKVKVGKKTKTFKCQVTVKGHKYGKVTYKWNKDYSKCTASKKCSRCGKSLKQTVKASSKTTTKATCTQEGAKKYTAKFTKYSFGTKNKSVSIKMKGHSVDSNKKISYKWNSNYSKCTATFYCKAGGEKVTETVKSTKKTSTAATKTSKGKAVYTATFKTKGLEKQTKTVTTPKLAYLDKTSITIKYGQPATIKVVNGTLAQGCGAKDLVYSTIDPHDPGILAVKFDGKECDTVTRPVNEEGEIDIVPTISYKRSNDMQSITFKAIKEAQDKTYTVSLLLSNGQTLECKVTTVFTPGEYYFGVVNHCYGVYHAYGKYKGTYAPNGSPDYYMDCNTRAEYDAAYEFYNHQVGRDGTECDLNQKSQDIYSACWERADYKSKARLEWEALSDEVQRNTYDDNFYNYVREKYGDAGMTYFDSYGSGFGENVTSNAQLKQIVDDWTAVSGEKPSWYYNEDGSIYYTAFSDWAEWSGRDIGLCSYTGYNESTDSFYQYYPPALPDNFRD